MERAEGTLLLAFVDVKRHGSEFAKHCALIISNKLKHGQKVYCFDYLNKEISGACSCGGQIGKYVRYKCTIFYQSFLCDAYDDAYRFHMISIDRRNSVANTEELIDMINGDSLKEAKQQLGKVLPLVEAAALPDGGRAILCRNCIASQFSSDERLELRVNSSWYDCAGCELKGK